MAVQRAVAEAIRTGDSANACDSACPAAPADTDARWMHDGAEFPWGTAAAGFDEQDLRARRSGRDAGTAAIDATVADLERPASRSADHTRAVFEPRHRCGRHTRSARRPPPYPPPPPPHPPPTR